MLSVSREQASPTANHGKGFAFVHESFPVKYGLGHRPREVSLLFSLSLSLSAFAVVVLQHLAVHAVFDGEDLEELLGRDGLAYLLVVDGAEACH